MLDTNALPRQPGRPFGKLPGSVWVLLLLSLVFSATGSGFLSVDNLLNIGTQSTILLLIALPMTLIIMTEGLDLSMGAVLTLCGVVLAMVMVSTGSLPLALGAALLTGLAFGLLNGALVSWLEIPPFVATLGTLGAAQGLALVATDGQSVVGIGDTIPLIYSGQLLGIPFPIWIAVAFYGLFHWLLYRTRFGAYVFALGGNREALKFSGVRINVCLIAVYVLGGLMAGVAALLLTARMNAGHPTAAIGLEFDAIAAVAVGGTTFDRGNGWLPGTVLGVLAVGVLRNGLNLVGVQSSVQVAAIGVLVLVVLLIESFKGKA
ncbi:ABC transporter permease [Cupriavidus basilensis]|uniref:ABC transporter permease n=1 Tax=Cupriavidus TaxID=106589 RepID=UPI00044C9C8B|nr:MULTISPECIES: ABC transporter permease [Cupriavidus]KDP85065.1 ABC transporter permease [Cupriavidus sp. SK-3]MDF3882599.1 ABC transporter permease [Cupriavidus basilensis]